MRRIPTLTATMSTVRPYPPLMTEISPSIGGRSFFPGGWGTYQGRHQTRLAERPILFFGQDFDTVDGHKASVLKGHEEDSATWQGINALLKKFEINPEACFFSNLFMGARHARSNTGSSPALKDAAFVQRCVVYAGKQVEILAPSVVVAFGTIPSVLLAGVFHRCPLPAAHNAKWSDVDAAGLQFIEAVKWPGTSAPYFAFASSLHPCLWRSNLKRRTWGALSGADAHDAIWKKIKEAVGP